MNEISIIVSTDIVMMESEFFCGLLEKLCRVRISVKNKSGFIVFFSFKSL